MQSLGNDFVVIDGVNRDVSLEASDFRFIADRRFGVGCDQILMVQPPVDSADFRFRIFNQDGSEVGQCGNGARCMARFLRNHKLINEDRVSLKTSTTYMELELHDNGEVTVDMSNPVFTPSNVPVAAEAETLQYEIDTPLGKQVLSALSMGNPHAVIQVDDVETAPVNELGSALQHHEFFPERVNVGFMAVKSRQRIDLRVHERGVGETLGCGSGACAAVVAGIRLGLLDREVTVRLPGGEAEVIWESDNSTVKLKGSAITVFESSIEI